MGQILSACLRRILLLVFEGARALPDGGLSAPCQATGHKANGVHRIMASLVTGSRS